MSKEISLGRATLQSIQISNPARLDAIVDRIKTAAIYATTQDVYELKKRCDLVPPP